MFVFLKKNPSHNQKDLEVVRCLQDQISLKKTSHNKNSIHIFMPVLNHRQGQPSNALEDHPFKA